MLRTENAYAARMAALGAVLVVHLTCGTGGSDGVIGPVELLDQLEQGKATVLLDVREPWEFRSGHIPGARNVPHRRVAAQLAVLALPYDRPIVVYGESGARAGRAAQVLIDSGYGRVVRLAGDIQGWRRAGLSVALGDRTGQ